jgi:hypothetical protein
MLHYTRTKQGMDDSLEVNNKGKHKTGTDYTAKISIKKRSHADRRTAIAGKKISSHPEGDRC